MTIPAGRCIVEVCVQVHRPGEGKANSSSDPKEVRSRSLIVDLVEMMMVVINRNTNSIIGFLERAREPK